MLYEAKELERLKIEAKDGNLGYVYDFFFDDLMWTTRYLVIDTGNWLTGRRVLVSPYSIEKPDLNEKKLKVSLSMEQIKNSPHISEDEPVSMQHQQVLADYYGWPVYWSVDPSLNAMGAMEMKKDNKEEGDPHLRSIREVREYNVEAVDGEVGYIHNFLIDNENWNIKYLIIDTRKWLHWLPGGKFVLVPPENIRKIDWSDSKVLINIDRDTIENAPEYDPEKQIDKEFENKLYDCYKNFLNKSYDETTA